MSTIARFGAGTSALALLTGLLLATPANAAVTTVTGDLSGTAKAVTSKAVTISAGYASSPLRLLKGRTFTLAVDANTKIKRGGATAKLSAVRAGDALTVRARCTFTITSASTRISCKALRLNATAPQLPLPVTFVINGKVAGLRTNSFAVTPTSFENDERAASVVAAIRATPPIWLNVDSSTVVRLGDSPAKFVTLGGGNTVQVVVTCQPRTPYNCMAQRIDILLPKAEPVTLVGLLTLVTANSVTLNVETAQHAESATTDVHMLRITQLTVAVPAGTPILRGADAVAMSSLALGVRVTVTARCRLVVPFDCSAEKITMK